MKCRIILCCISLAVQVHAFTWKAYATHANGEQYTGEWTWIQATTDADAGGFSIIRDTVGNMLGASGGKNFTPELYGTRNLNKLTAILHIGNWVPSSSTGWGWAQVGWSIFKDPRMAVPGLADTLELELSYPKDEVLTLQLGGADLSTTAADGAPEFKIKGTGAVQLYKVPFASFARPKWSANPSWSLSNFASVNILRVLQAQTLAQSISAIPHDDQRLELYCVSSGKKCSTKKQSSNSWVIKTADFDMQGINGDARLVADDDSKFGGTSAVSDGHMSGHCIGPCGATPQWNYTEAFYSGYLASFIQTKQYPTKTADAWAGWWVYPKIDPNKNWPDSAWSKRAQPLNLEIEDTLELEVKWSGSSDLSLVWAAQNIDVTQMGMALPEWKQRGNDSMKIWRFPIGALRLPNWVSSSIYDPHQFVGLGFLRKVARAATFPTSEKEIMRFELKCIALNASCGSGVVDVQSIPLMDHAEIELLDLQGRLLTRFANRAAWQIAMPSLQAGIYVLRQGSNVQKWVVR